MKYDFKFTPEQREGVTRMYSILFDNYSAIKEGGVGRKRLLGSMKFLATLKDRKTYSSLSQSKLNEIRRMIIKRKYKNKDE